VIVWVNALRYILNRLQRHLTATSRTLVSVIIFAYSINANDFQVVMSQLPKWANVDRFEVEARADGNPIKDRIRIALGKTVFHVAGQVGRI
jgi:hypothetical protein